MIPVHIWAHSNIGDLTPFPEYFYDLRNGRHTIYDRPIIHKRTGRLDYQHVGEFAQVIFADVRKPSIHLFVLSPDDLLQGPINRALGSVCCTLMKVAWTCNSVVTLFVNLATSKFLNYVSDTSLTCNYIITHYCKKRPKRAASFTPKFVPWNVTHKHYLSQTSNLELVFQDLVSALYCVKLEGREIRVVNN